VGGPHFSEELRRRHVLVSEDRSTGGDPACLPPLPREQVVELLREPDVSRRPDEVRPRPGRRRSSPVESREVELERELARTLAFARGGEHANRERERLKDPIGLSDLPSELERALRVGDGSVDVVPGKPDVPAVAVSRRLQRVRRAGLAFGDELIGDPKAVVPAPGLERAQQAHAPGEADHVRVTGSLCER